MNRNQSDIAYDFLRNQLIQRELPSGTRVRYGPLGDQIGMSATPVREAIGRLASEGLVELIPQAGAVVKRLSRSDAVEVFEMREAIEPYAAAKAAQLISLVQLKSLQRSLDVISALVEMHRTIRWMKNRPSCLTKRTLSFIWRFFARQRTRGC